MRIYDDLYGLIEFDDEYEKPIIDSQFFQRLRKIKQLSLAHYVFPGANHTRFSHSLGVAHLAGEVAKRLRLTKADTRLLRTAALLHDIGHFPLSHAIEAVYKEQLFLINKIAQETGHKARGKLFSFVKERLTHGKVHEAISAFVVRYSDLSELIEFPEDVSELITGSLENKRYLSQILHSDLDIDKMDYLRRDAKATGINYGEFALSYLLGNLTLKRGKDEPSLLSVDEKALHTVEHFILAKRFYYLQIIFHKKRMVYDYLAQIIAKELMMKELLPSLVDLEKWITKTSGKDFISFDDGFFMDAVKKSVPKNTARLYAVYDAVLNRRNIMELLRNRITGLVKSRDYNKTDILQGATRIIDKESLRDRNLLESKQIKDIAIDWKKWVLASAFSKLSFDDCRHFLSTKEDTFPLVVEDIEIYPDSDRTAEKAKEVECVAIDERDTIKIHRHRRRLENINSLDSSMVSMAAGYTTYVARYYYIPEKGD